MYGKEATYWRFSTPVCPTLPPVRVTKRDFSPPSPYRNLQCSHPCNLPCYGTNDLLPRNGINAPLTCINAPLPSSHPQTSSPTCITVVKIARRLHQKVTWTLQKVKRGLAGKYHIHRL